MRVVMRHACASRLQQEGEGVFAKPRGERGWARGAVGGDGLGGDSAPGLWGEVQGKRSVRKRKRGGASLLRAVKP